MDKLHTMETYEGM